MIVFFRTTAPAETPRPPPPLPTFVCEFSEIVQLVIVLPSDVSKDIAPPVTLAELAEKVLLVAVSEPFAAPPFDTAMPPPWPPEAELFRNDEPVIVSGPKVLIPPPSRLVA